MKINNRNSWAIPPISELWQLLWEKGREKREQLRKPSWLNVEVEKEIEREKLEDYTLGQMINVRA